MSFGFAVGDFIAVGELCWKLYSKVYEVSREAPETIQNLHDDLGHMNLTINKLIEDAQTPDSILAQSSSDRQDLAHSVIKETRHTLEKLNDISERYEHLQKPSSNFTKRHFWKRNYDKVKFAAESRTINDLRAKLVFHNGQISLLLQIVQSSSLERIENMQKKTENALQDIKAAISGTTSTTPLLSGSSGADPHILTRKLLENAEVDGRLWTSIGIRDWLQTGKWWLLKAQSRLYSAAPQTPEYSQARVDLIKASWILTDIVALHPQRNFFGSGIQEMDILDIVQAVKSQHEDLSKKSLPSPTLHELERSSWKIWIGTSSTALLPSLGGGGRGSRQWGTVGGFILFRRFAILHTSTGVHECIVFLEAKKEKTFTLIAQSFEGQDLCRHSVPDQFDAWKTRTSEGNIREDNVIRLHNGIQLKFSTREDFLTACLLTCGADLCAGYAANYPSDETLVYTMALLDIFTTASPCFDEAVRAIKPRTKELIHDNSSSNEHSKPLWDLMQTVTPQQLTDFWKREERGRHFFKFWQRGRRNLQDRYWTFILQFSESLEQCGTIFGSFPKLMKDGVRAVIESAVRGDYTHSCISTPDLRELLGCTSENKALTHEILNAFSHVPARGNVSPLDLAKYSFESENWHGVWYVVTKGGNIGINGTLPSEIWNLKFALVFMSMYGAPLELLDNRPSSLDVFKMAPYLVTFAVIIDGLEIAAPRLSWRGLLDPNLPALENGDGVDILSGLDRLGTPHWPLSMAVNMCSHPEIIQSLCQAGAHLGDDEVLYSDLEIYKALLSRSNSQAEQIYSDTVALVRTAGSHPELRTNESMVPEAFISTYDQSIPFRRYCRIPPYVYHELGAGKFERRWKPEVLSILRETQAERNLHAWLRRNATITSALE